MKDGQQIKTTVISICFIALLAISMAGCLSPSTPQVSPSPSPTAAISTTTVAKVASPTVAKQAQASPTLTVKPTPTPSVVPTPRAKIATAVDANKFFDTDNTVTRGSPVTLWGFNVVSQGAQPQILCGAPLTALIDGRPAGTLTLQAGPNCFQTANYGLSAQETNDLSVGTHTLTIRYAGDTTYQPSELVAKIEVS